MKRVAVPSILVAVVLLALVVIAEAQQAKKVPRIGYLGLSDPSSRAFQLFQQGLREVGYIEGQNVLMESRFAFGNEWRLDTLAAEIVGLNVNAIVAQSAPALFAARGMTKTIPIVMNYFGNPVTAGLVATLERPGKNVTGISGLAAGLGGKWLEILKETVPELRRWEFSTLAI
jgi:putative ABC transport system substrate-binding protein